MPERRRARARLRRDDGGFGVVEVIVALGLLGTIAAAVLPVIVLSSTAAVLARDRTQAKNLAAGRLEELRTLPFHLSRASQPAGSSLDLLDQWFPSTAVAGSPSTSSTYVPPSATGIPAGEPSGGTYYRTHRPSLGGTLAAFSETVTVQFLDLSTTGTRTVVAPPSGYSSTTVGADTPPSRLVEVRVLLRWTYAGQVRTERLVSQLADAGNARVTPGQVATGQSVLAQARSTAVQVVDATSVDQVRARVGVASADGAVGTSASAGTSAESAVVGPLGGVTGQGARGSTAAPPDATSTAGTGGAWTSDAGCTGACFGPSSAPSQASRVVAGLPAAGGAGTPSTSNPAVSVLSRRDLCPAETCLRGQRPLAFSGRLQQDAARGLDYTGSDSYGAVTLADPASGDAARGTAAITSSSGTGAAVTAVATAAVGRLDLLPTTSSRAAGAGGLVRVVLESASLSCTASAGAQSATASYRGVLSYWGRTGAGYGYTAVPFERTPSGVVTGGVLPDPATVVVSEGLLGERRLSEYLQSWAITSTPSTTVEGGTRTVRASLVPVRLVTTALGTPGSESTLSVDVAALSCTAQDAR